MNRVLMGIWSSLTKKEQSKVLTWGRNRQWKRISEASFHADLRTKKQIKDFYLWAINEKDGPTEEENKMEYQHSHWYDSEREVYVLILPSKKKPFALPAEIWKSMREAYSNWDSSPTTVNEIARKHSLSRRTVIEIFRVMGTTHDSSPWTEEELGNNSEESLIEDLLRKKEESVLVKAQKIEWKRIKRDAEKFRRFDLFTSHIEAKLAKKVFPKITKPKVQRPQGNSEHIIVISPTDFHWGKYGPGYTKDPYDRSVAKQRLFASTEELISRCLVKGKPEKIILAIGGDGLHIDNMQRNTTAGTPQDCDGTPEEIAWSWVELCVDYVSMVREYADVCLFVVPGNHDYYTSIIMRSALHVFFREDPHVEVVKGLSPRQYLTYGKNLLCFLHGDIGAVKDWPAIIAGEAPKEWGYSDNRFIFSGHFHTERQLPSFGNVTVYRMPSLAGTDSWHHKKGYKSRKALIAYLVDKSHGVITHEIAPVKEEGNGPDKADKKHI